MSIGNKANQASIIKVSPMRSNSIHDKAGNNYRYLRAQKRLQEQEEKQLSDSKWTKIYDKIIIDPNADEQEIASARLTLVTDENGKYVSAQKGKPGGFTFEELKELSVISKEKGEEIRKMIKEAVNNGA